MVLIDVVANLDNFDRSHTIYAMRPWTPRSTATVADAPLEALVPEHLASVGLSYFLEVDLAIEFLEAWASSLGARPSRDQACGRLIQYATNDA